MKIFYFTGTGNSLYIAKSLSNDIYSIPQLLEKDGVTYKDDIIGFVFPVYCFGMPQMVKEFIKYNSFESNYIFSIATHGGGDFGLPKRLKKLFKKSKLQLKYATGIEMVANYPPFSAIEDELKKECLNEIDTIVENIKTDINNQLIKTDKSNIFITFFGKLGNSLFKNYHTGKNDKKFVVKDTCTKCGICLKVCPAKNIRIDSKPKFLHMCEGCFACVQHCPTKTINSKKSKSDTRYINQNVTIEEIIKSNNQFKSNKVD